MYADVLFAMALGGVPTLMLVTQHVIDVESWFSPRHIIPLGGMIFASTMNTVSPAAERLLSGCRLANFADTRMTASVLRPSRRDFLLE